MIVPDLETAERITWMTEMLLSHGRNALPVGLTAALREYKSALLAACATEEWARPGHPARYGKLADLIALQAAHSRAQTLVAAANATDQNQGTGQLSTFLTRGSGYQPQTVQMFH